MAGGTANLAIRTASRTGARAASPLVKWTLIAVALVFLTLILLLPLGVVAIEALSEGLGVFTSAITDPVARNAIALTLLVAAISLPASILFGLCASWAITKFRFPGKQLLITLIDLPFSISPVIAGMVFVLLFAANDRSLFGGWIQSSNLRVIFAVPGIVLATMFVTFPFVARELIPLMQAQGKDEEEAAVSLGAHGLSTYLRVTLPNIKWGLLYAVILCNARAMGEFGAVSVVSGHIEGKTNTMPLHIEILFNDYQTAAAFAVAALLVLMAVGTIIAKSYVEWRAARDASIPR